MALQRSELTSSMRAIDVQESSMKSAFLVRSVFPRRNFFRRIRCRDADTRRSAH
jgi:hypothetical protein